ncbi:sugar phosphate isomerase/epimerase family protein [Salmonirosea aquatica]
MKPVVFVILSLLVGHTEALSQKIDNDFFVLHNAIRGDSVYKTFDQQVSLIKSLGYDGVEINQLESFAGMKAALDQHQFKGSYLYFKINVDQPQLDERLESIIAQLKGSGTLLAPYMVSDSKKFKPSSHEADAHLTALLQQLGKWAQKSNLQVALYPHYGFYVETIDHALKLVKAADMKNVGLSFNLCHWLATTPLAERTDWKKDLKTLQPYLKMVTISGANQVDSQAKTPWDDYILPLGTGTYDTYDLVSYLVKDLKYKGPIGVQCYNIKADKPELLRSTMQVWQTYKSKLESE